MKTTNTVLNAIADLNLEPIKNKLMDAQSGEGWSRAKVEAMDLEYRRFLHLMHAFPNQSVSPTKAVDTFWHYHILDTQRYAADCDAVFGCFMHHNPYGDESGADAGEDSGVRMRDMYEATFGEAYIRPEVYLVDHADAAIAFGAGATADAKAAVCQCFCMMQAQPGNANEAAIAAIAADAKSAVCQCFCMMQAGVKDAAKPAGAKSAVRRSSCMRVGAGDEVGAAARGPRQNLAVGASASFA